MNDVAVVFDEPLAHSTCDKLFNVTLSDTMCQSIQKALSPRNDVLHCFSLAGELGQLSSTRDLQGYINMINGKKLSTR